MHVLRSLDDARAVRGGFLSIGNFDGVHRAHRSMIAALIELARRHDAPAVVFTFDPHPIALLRPHEAPPPLTTTARKLELLEECGVETALVYPTDHAFLNLSPRAFFDEVVVGRLEARGLVEGPNFRFGHDRAGSVETLRGFCAAAGLMLEVVPPVFAGGRLVSSTEIRRLIAEGEVAAAAELLGSSYRISGIVVRGAERGRTLGFPTANIENVRTVVPRDGVYAGRVVVDGAPFAAAINVGASPTFADEQRKLEAHLIDFAGDLYGRRLDIEFLARLRDTVRFAGPAELREQLSRDVARARGTAGPEGQRGGGTEGQKDSMGGA